MNKGDIWIILPAKDESRHIGNLLKKVTVFTKNIVVVDDGSQDATTEIAQKYTKHVLKHPINIGKGAALKTGCEYAFKQLDAKAVILMDSDEQHDHEDIPRFFSLLKKGSSLILGERTMATEMPLIRIIFNRFASVLILVLFGKYIPDIPSGFKAFTKKIYQDIKWQSRGYEVEMEIATHIAIRKLDFDIIRIRTIYHDYDRGMTFLDAIAMASKLIAWKLIK